MRRLSLWMTLLALVFLAGKRMATDAESVEVCTGESLQASCASDEVIRMTSAKLGRMETGRCITENEFMGCENDVLPTLTRRCSGRRECDLEELELETENKQCSKALKMYLKASYSCLKVESRCNSNSATRLTQEEAYLSSHTRVTKNCGSPRSPWVISAQPGQTINMSLIDFAASDNNNFISCKYVYGYILERALGINHTICGGRHRDGKLYSSKTNNVEIVLAQKPRNTENWSFLLHFQILGCPELERPAHAWYRREGNEAVIGCEDNDQEWRLTCTGNTWHGSTGNCTKAVVVVAPEEPEEVQFDTVIIMTCVAGGAVVAVVITIVIGTIYIKKYRMRQETKHLQKTYVTMEREVQAYLSPANQEASLLRHNTTNPRLVNTWEMMPPDARGTLLASYPVDCSGSTLPVRHQGEVVTSGGTADRQSIYSHVK